MYVCVWDVVCVSTRRTKARHQITLGRQIRVSVRFSPFQERALSFRAMLRRRVLGNLDDVLLIHVQPLTCLILSRYGFSGLALFGCDVDRCK